MSDPVIYSLRGDIQFLCYLFMGEMLATIHLVCFTTLFGKLPQCFFVEWERLVAQIEIRVIEFAFVFLYDFLMYSSFDLKMGKTIESLVLYDGEK